MDINYELYRVFHSVAKNLSFTAAAGELYLSQSAVSQSIKQLEQKLGCSLFYRSTKSVKLTSEGKLLFEYVSQGLNYFKTGERLLLDRQQLSAGDIRLATTDTICKYFLLAQIRDFHIGYPNITFTIINRTSPECLDLLKKGEVDLAVCNIPPDLSEDVYNLEKFVLVHDAFILAPEFWQDKKQPATMEELAANTLIVLDKKTVTREFFDELFAKQDIAVTPEIELTSIDLLIEMTKAGLGVGFVPTYCLKHTPMLSKVNLKERFPARRMGITTMARLPKSNLIQKFIDALELNI